MPLRALSTSSTARATMRQAFEELERSIIPTDSRTLQANSTLHQARLSILEIEKELASRGSIRNMRRLTPLLNGMEHYSKSIEILCNGTPYLSWIWAPVILVLRIASDYIEAFERIMKGYSQIAESLTRFAILSGVFPRNHDLQNSLAIFYADILRFHTYAYKFVRRSGWRALFLTAWGRSQRRFDNIFDDLRRHGELIDKEANAIDISESMKMRQDIRRWREESLDEVKYDEAEQASKQYREVISWLKVDETEQTSVFDSLAEESTKFPGTCAWILKDPKISAWLRRQAEMPFVWLQGNAGFGKSMLATCLVNFIRTQKLKVVHHFCTYSYSSSTRYEYILRSILIQLLRNQPDVTGHVYTDCVVGKKRPALPRLESLVQMAITSMSDQPREFEYVWIIVDALDECEIERQAHLIRLLYNLSSKKLQNTGTMCKVLISSRSSPLVSKQIRTRHVMSLTDQVEHLEGAIHLYASHRLRALEERLRQLELDSRDIDAIGGAIAKKANGMFLYARLVLDYVAANIFYTGDELKESINLLPKTLSEFYEKILTQILANRDIRSVQRIRTTLGWVAFAKRPLKKAEFLSALAFSAGDPTVKSLVPQYILDMCSPLLEERRDMTLAFIHVSVKDYLQEPSSSLVLKEHEMIAEHGLASIACLLSGLNVFCCPNLETTRCLRLIRGIHGFHVYATEYWTEYILYNASTEHGIHLKTPLNRLAHELARVLDDRNPVPQFPIIADSHIDERMYWLRENPMIYRHVERALSARSKQRLESELLIEEDDENTLPHPAKSGSIDQISMMLETYQSTIELLLDQDFWPGASVEDLERFKNNFRTSAFTCRLRACPRATLGFESRKLRHEHELAHTGGFRCTFAGCQYPPFRSAASLKGHTEKHHAQSPPRKSIRKQRGLSDKPSISRKRRQDVALHVPMSPGMDSFSHTVDKRQKSHASETSRLLPQIQKAASSRLSRGSHPSLTLPRSQTIGSGVQESNEKQDLSLGSQTGQELTDLRLPNVDFVELDKFDFDSFHLGDDVLQHAVNHNPPVVNRENLIPRQLEGMELRGLENSESTSTKSPALHNGISHTVQSPLLGPFNDHKRRPAFALPRSPPKPPSVPLPAVEPMKEWNNTMTIESTPLIRGPPLGVGGGRPLKSAGPSPFGWTSAARVNMRTPDMSSGPPPGEEVFSTSSQSNARELPKSWSPLRFPPTVSVQQVDGPPDLFLRDNRISPLKTEARNDYSDRSTATSGVFEGNFGMNPSDFSCGVPISESLTCAEKLRCPHHSRMQQNLVEGRSRPLVLLIAQERCRELRIAGIFLPDPEEIYESIPSQGLSIYDHVIVVHLKKIVDLKAFTEEILTLCHYHRPSKWLTKRALVDTFYTTDHSQLTNDLWMTYMRWREC